MAVMNENIEEFIEKKPHLQDVLRLYEKVIKFVGAIRELPLQMNIPINPSLDDIAYPSGLVNPIFEKFSSIFDIPEENLASLKEAMRLGQIDLTRLPLNEVPSFSLPYHEEELGMILFLIGKPYFLRLRDLYNIDNTFWQEGRCPVCNSMPSIASIDKDGRRYLYCSFCETTGHYKRIGCPVCLSEDASRINIIIAEGEESFRIDTCDACNSYIKTVELRIIRDITPDVADIISLPLDIIAQDKGYRRNSPNPLGMLRMT